MSDLRTEALKIALETLELLDKRGGLGLDVHEYIRTKIEALRQALAQPEQEPDWGTIAEEQLKAAKTAMGKTLEDAAVHAVHKLYNIPPEQDYERGFIDGMQKQMQSTVEKAVNSMTKQWQNLTDDEIGLDDNEREDLARAGEDFLMPESDLRLPSPPLRAPRDGQE